MRPPGRLYERLQPPAPQPTGRPALRLAAAAVAVALLVGACSSSASPSASPSSSPPGASGTPGPADRFAAFAPCTDQRAGPSGWLCATLDVPVNRANPAAGTIPILVWVKPHTDQSAPAGEPFFTTAGGLGADGLQNFAVFWMTQGDSVQGHHDIVTIDARGTGQSGAILCQDLQDGFHSRAEFTAAIAACGAQLGAASDRYGSADRAMDLDAVRAWLGYDQIIYYGASNASHDVQAYAARYPDRLRAVILDAGSVENGANAWYDPGDPASLLTVADLTCADDAACHAAAPDPAGLLTRLIHEVAARPIHGTSQGTGAAVAVVESNLLFLIDVGAAATIKAAAAWDGGDPQPLIDLAVHDQFVSSGDGDYHSFSTGAQFAAQCNDLDYPYDHQDSPAVKRQKVDAALAALPEGTFAPFSNAGWIGFDWFDVCVDWPAPSRYEPVLHAGDAFPNIPALLLAGDRDAWAVSGMARMLSVFPSGGSVVIVPGAGHPALSAGACVRDLIADFITTLQVGALNCPG